MGAVRFGSLRRDSFDFLAMPSVNRAPALEKARCAFLANHENVLVLANRKTWKTLIARLGLGCQRDYVCVSLQPQNWLVN